jgi:diacylglycerol kinase
LSDFRPERHHQAHRESGIDIAFQDIQDFRKSAGYSIHACTPTLPDDTELRQDLLLVGYHRVLTWLLQRADLGDKIIKSW